jgi:hypothetical protein
MASLRSIGLQINKTHAIGWIFPAGKPGRVGRA